METISSLPLLTTSQAQPLPKRPMPAASNFSLKASKLPKAALMSSPSLPEGAPPAFGPRIFQNMEWFAWPPPLLRTAPRMSRRHRVEVADEVLDGLAFEVRLAGDGLVDVGHVGGVMFVVVDLHRLRINVRFERVFGIRKRR